MACRGGDWEKNPLNSSRNKRDWKFKVYNEDESTQWTNGRILGATHFAFQNI